MSKHTFLNAREPIHKQIAERIKDMIARKYKPGDLLPKYRELTEHFGVGLLTVNKAMRLLADQGIVSPIRRKGTTVTRTPRPREMTLSRMALIFSGPITRLFGISYLSSICQSIFERAEALRVDVHLLSLYRDEVGDRPRDMAETGVDGVILLSMTNVEHLTAFAEMNIAAVSADQLASDQGLDSVVCNEVAAATEILHHLALLGHRNVIYAEINTPQWKEAGRQRRECFHAAARSQGIAVDTGTYLVESTGEINSMIVALAQKVRSKGDRPTAIVADDASRAATLIGQLGQLGVNVPGDISMAAIATSVADPGTAYQQLTCCQFDFHDMGHHAMKLLELRRVKPLSPEPSVIEISPSFVEGSSTIRAESA